MKVICQTLSIQFTLKFFNLIITLVAVCQRKLVVFVDLRSLESENNLKGSVAFDTLKEFQLLFSVRVVFDQSDNVLISIFLSWTLMHDRWSKDLLEY